MPNPVHITAFVFHDRQTHRLPLMKGRFNCTAEIIPKQNKGLWSLSLQKVPCGPYRLVV